MNKKIIVPFLCVEAVIFAMCAAVCFLCKLPFYEGLFYFLYQLCGILIPGMALLSLLEKRSSLYEDSILFSYVFGLCIVVIEYFLWATAGTKIPAIVISGICFIVSLFCLFRNKDCLKCEYDLMILIYAGLFLLLVYFCFFSVSYHFIMPDLYGSAVYNKDFLFWVGNSISLTKGFPLYNFRLIGDAFYYQYFSNIIIAMASMSTGIDILHLSVCFSYFIPCLLLVLSCRYFLSSLLKNKLALLAGCVFILLADGSTCYLPDHLYFCPFGFDYGYAFAMICAGHLIRMHQKDDFPLSDVIVSCMLIMMNTGFKAPIALISLMMYGMVTFNLLFRKKWIRGFSLGTVWLLSFVIIYIFIISGIDFGKERKNGLLILGMLGAFDRNRWAIEIFSDLIGNHGYPDNGITRIVALFLYVYRSNKAAMILLMASAVILPYLLIRKKKTAVLFALICTSLWGILWTLNTFQDGNSQMYFIMSSFPFAVLAGLYALESISFNKFIPVVAILLLAVLSYGDINNLFTDSFRKQYDQAFLIQKGEVPVEDKRYLFTSEEYHLAQWLKENTGSRDLIALDHFEYGEYRKEEMLGVFSERFIWNDGLYSPDDETQRRRELTEKVLSGNSEALDRMKEENVNYFVQTMSLEPDFRINGAKIVYESEGYRVYKLS